MAVPPNQMTPILVVVHARCLMAEAVQHGAFNVTEPGGGRAAVPMIAVLEQTYARR